MLSHCEYRIFIAPSTTKGDIETFDERMDLVESEGNCVEPTRENPFMNVLLTDYGKHPSVVKIKHMIILI